MTRLGQEADWETRLLQDASAWLSPQPGGRRAIVIPGGGEISFTLPAGDSGVAQARPGGQSVLVSAFILGVQTLAMTYDALPGWPAVSQPKLASVVNLATSVKDCLSAGESLVRNGATLSASGTGWALADRATYCVNGSVPKAIYVNACQTQ